MNSKVAKLRQLLILLQKPLRHSLVEEKFGTWYDISNSNGNTHHGWFFSGRFRIQVQSISHRWVLRRRRSFHRQQTLAPAVIRPQYIRRKAKWISLIHSQLKHYNQRLHLDNWRKPLLHPLLKHMHRILHLFLRPLQQTPSSRQRSPQLMSIRAHLRPPPIFRASSRPLPPIQKHTKQVNDRQSSVVTTHLHRARSNPTRIHSKLSQPTIAGKFH